MIPLRSLAEVRIVVGPPAIIRYNNLRAVTVQGSPAPGVSSGRRSPRWRQVAASTLPQGYAAEWTDTAFQEKRAEGKTAIILGFARPVRLSVPGRALRELDHPGAGPAVGLGRHRSARSPPS